MNRASVICLHRVVPHEFEKSHVKTVTPGFSFHISCLHGLQETVLFVGGKLFEFSLVQFITALLNGSDPFAIYLTEAFIGTCELLVDKIGYPRFLPARANYLEV